MEPPPISCAKKPKAAIFDLDGVLVRSEEAHRATFNEVFSRFGFRIGKRYWMKNYAGKGSLFVMEDAFGKHGVKEGAGAWVKKRAGIYRRYIRKNGLPTTRGLRSIMGLLGASGVRIAVASGGERKNVAASLRAAGLGRLPYFGAEDVQNPKPAPDVFLLAAKKLCAKPSECLVFEDSLAGVAAAKRAGMACIALATTLPKRALAGKAMLVAKDFSSPSLKRAVLRLVRGR